MLVATLADAIAHAHARGVVHRDLKPANVLLAGVRGQESGVRSQESGVRNQGTEVTRQMHAAALTPDSCYLTPKVTDFGLAKLAGDSAQPTRTGSALGTPAYMAPEQARGRSSEIGPAADVYALGAILYELLTGRPPFRGESDVDTLRKVTDLEPVPPHHLRPGLPRDLETVCLKCLEKVPARRYASAAALADDLGRFAAGRPVLARPVGPLGRMARWCQRKPAVATLLAGLATAIGLGAFGIGREYRRANQERDTAVAEQARNARLFDEACGALQRMIDTGDAFTHDYAHVAQGREILEVAQAYYRGLRREDAGNVELRRQAALVGYRLTVLYAEAGQLAEFEAAIDETARLYEELIAADPDDRGARLKLVWLMWHGMRCHRVKGTHRQSAACRDRALPLARSLYESDPNEPEYALLWAAFHCHRADLAVADDDLPAAEVDYRAALDIWQRQPPDRRRAIYPGGLATYQARLATVRLLRGDLDEAEARAENALARAAEVKPGGPLGPNPAEFLGEARLIAGRVRAARGRTAEAIVLLRDAADVLAPTVQTSQLPGVVSWLRMYCAATRYRADLLASAGRHLEAVEVLTKSLGVRPKPHPLGFTMVPLADELECRVRLVEALLRSNEPAAAQRAWKEVNDLLVEPQEPTAVDRRAIAAVRALAGRIDGSVPVQP